MVPPTLLQVGCVKSSENVIKLGPPIKFSSELWSKVPLGKKPISCNASSELLLTRIPGPVTEVGMYDEFGFAGYAGEVKEVACAVLSSLNPYAVYDGGSPSRTWAFIELSKPIQKISDKKKVHRNLNRNRVRIKKGILRRITAFVAMYF